MGQSIVSGLAITVRRKRRRKLYIRCANVRIRQLTSVMSSRKGQSVCVHGAGMSTVAPTTLFVRSRLLKCYLSSGCKTVFSSSIQTIGTAAREVQEVHALVEFLALGARSAWSCFAPYVGEVGTRRPGREK